MSVSLKKADGDLFINVETGRAEEVSGPTKVDQELFSLYTTVFDPSRNWGSNTDVRRYKNIGSLALLRSKLFGELTDAHRRIQTKQTQDLYLDKETELIRSFSRVEVMIDPASQGAFFITEAKVGNDNTIVGKQLFQSFKPLSTRHVSPPPSATGYKAFKG